MRDMPERLQGGNKVSVQQFPQKINYENENGFNFKIAGPNCLNYWPISCMSLALLFMFMSHMIQAQPHARNCDADTRRRLCL